ncbi:DUF1674-domain-containing protein [Astrocystis sublimbata]|nr:DUF1674-domain-containing protein [Astrocystis sublimbata]
MSAHLARLVRPLAHMRPSSSPITTITTTTTTPTLATSRTPLSIRLSSTSPFGNGPSPPRLPADQQAEFERLQRTANTQSGFNPTSTPDFSSPSTPTSTSTSSPQAAAPSASTPALSIGVEAAPTPTPLRKGAPPEFEGEVNPRTGEVGGPKNEPLRWGAGGDYSYNGRVTDF